MPLTNAIFGWLIELDTPSGVVLIEKWKAEKETNRGRSATQITLSLVREILLFCYNVYRYK